MKYLSLEKIFTNSIYKWLKIFGINNIIFLIAFITLWYLRWKLVNFALLLIISTLLIFINISVLYFMAFIKKGYELQSENDLTI